MTTATICYSIEFLSDWLCSSGLTAEADDLPLIDAWGLPYIPGKTLKGLFREAAQNIADYSGQTGWQQFIDHCFGRQTRHDSEGSESGCCYFANAEPSQRLKKLLYDPQNPDDQVKRQKRKSLFRTVAFTAIDENGQAKEHSLRTIEVVVPLTLFAEIDNCPDRDKMIRCLHWVKRLGMSRHRGFGRCKIKEL